MLYCLDDDGWNGYSSLIEVIKESCDASQEAKVMSIEAISAGKL